MSHKIFKYPCISYKSKSWSYELVTFFCQASEMQAWSGVFRKEITKKGYQRTWNEKHSTAISDFLSSEQNCIPNSVVIAFNDQLEIGGKKQNAAKVTNKQKHSLENTAHTKGAKDTETECYSGTLEITVHPEIMKIFSDAIDSNSENLADFKSAFVIDGQHRMLGAGMHSKPKYFPVSAFIGIDKEDQAFHFIVINGKARKVTKTDIDSVVPVAIYENLQKRLVAARIFTTDADFVYALDNDTDSPFQNLVKWPNNRAGIYTKGGLDNIPKLLKTLDKDITEKFSDDLVDLAKAIWRGVRKHLEPLWVKSQYSETSTSNYDNQWIKKCAALIPAVQMYCNDLLESEFPSQSKTLEKDIENLVYKKIKKLPLEFFYCQWKKKSLTNEDRKKDIMKLLKKVIRTEEMDYKGEWFDVPLSKENQKKLKEEENKRKRALKKKAKPQRKKQR